MAPALPTLEKLMCFKDPEILSNTLWTIEHLSEAGEGPAECVMEMDCFKLFIECAQNDYEEFARLRTPALRILGNCLECLETDKRV